MVQEKGTLYRQEYRDAYREVLNNPSEETAFRVLNLANSSRVKRRGFLGTIEKVMKPLAIEDYYSKEIILGVDAARKNYLCGVSALIKDEERFIAFNYLLIPSD